MKTRWLALVTVIYLVVGVLAPALGSEIPSHRDQERFWNQVARDMEKSLARGHGSLKSRLDNWLLKLDDRYGEALRLEDRQKLIRIANGNEGSIFRLIKDTEPLEQPTANFVIVHDKRGWHCQMLTCDISYYNENMLATVARISHGYLLLGGVMKEMSNAPRGGVQAFRKTRSGWKLVSSLDTEMESWAGADEKLSNHDITIITRGRAENFDKPHCGPSATWADTFGIVKGKLRFIRERRRGTAVNALDDLVGFVKTGRTKDVRSRCLNSQMARRLMAKRRQFEKADLLITSNADTVSDDDKAMYLEGTGLWFRFAFQKGRWVLVELKEKEAR